jgi:hypothetical protein
LSKQPQRSRIPNFTHPAPAEDTRSTAVTE